jgi:hypothetical protein
MSFAFDYEFSISIVTRYSIALDCVYWNFITPFGIDIEYVYTLL